MGIVYKTGKKEESLRLAELINIASDRVVEYLFRDLMPDMTPVQIVAHHLEGDNYPHSYRSAIVAEYKQMVVGMALPYPSHFHTVTEEMKEFFPIDRLEHLQPFYSARVENSLFLAALCVEKEFRGKGIGSELIALTKKKAKESHYDILSGIVFADNTNAQRLYRRHGFEVVETIELKPHELIPHGGGCLLMKCEVHQ